MESVATQRIKPVRTVHKKAPAIAPIPDGYMSLEQFEQEVKEAIRKKL